MPAERQALLGDLMSAEQYARYDRARRVVARELINMVAGGGADPSVTLPAMLRMLLVLAPLDPILHDMFASNPDTEFLVQ